MNFGQVLTAMVTPFDQNGEIDFNATRTLVNYLISNGSDGLVVAGTTGESPTLTDSEKLELFRFVAQVAEGRAAVIAGTGSNNTRASIELTKQAEQTGVDAVMLTTPYYNKPSQEGLYQHYKAVAEATSLPVMLYNIPGRSAAKIAPETIIRLSEIENIVSVKEASGDLDAMTEIITKTGDDFTLYSGDDGLTLPVLAIGGTGVVSVSAHILGNEMQEMVNCYNYGDVKRAAIIHQEILPVMKAMFAQPSPSPVKAALNLMGIHVGDVRLPMVPLTTEEINTLQQNLPPYKVTAAG
ncbi:4-hydroxy-tetrahydrodipicolinate synthase [Thalassobacillus devorans]|uniref:4-hydroxy-tetrahydrodipicolinate synthase n=1 Tax=Thalassobacillus devorans TaxID=279813 RepID=A0ABQ1PLG6_9BACI|nr:4-hydroxy-tetrahydrodipicolinate synthase [Thalassobacillus devorans]NIK30216.1 4-hydroxy-tetrahydrodipicolinate synthase [Thalassobacillus devorans]GGC99284.1 4-hydroxy-tetrahydrodipicolinate synthase [Thalassobacillus devorans]